MGNEKVDPWALLREARESVQLLANKLHNELDYDYSEEQEQLCFRIDAALAEVSQKELTTCEFCKGKGHVPAKKAWSPESVLGQGNGR